MKSIGGYFSLELFSSKEYYNDAIRLNCGRNALEYILRAKNYTKLFLPSYACDVLLEPLLRLNIAYEFYAIDESLDPLNIQTTDNFEAFLYINYFGLKEKTTASLQSKINNYIVDNSQGFFSRPIAKIDTFYSPRKFFGIPDGAYLYTNSSLDIVFEKDVSANRFLHLLKRIESGPEEGYNNFLENEKSLENQAIKHMSNLTQRMLNSIDYDTIRKTRTENFKYLHENLQFMNELSAMIETVNPIDGPLIYPLLIKNGKEIRERLLNQKLYIATYWSNVLQWAENDSFEYYLAQNLVALPIDQRYNTEDMDYILNLIK